MTAEIAIMNKVAVALAADSAVTIESVSEDAIQQKIYNTTNKLFTLSKYQPVGIMVYGNAELLRVPWEVIIKLYRKKLARRKFNTVKEYAIDLINFLNSFFPPSEQDASFVAGISSYYYGVIFNTFAKTGERK